jgi:hypothetical protein
MRVDEFRFGRVRIDGRTYEHDVIITGNTVRKRKKKRSKPYRQQFGHTPLSLAEEIPWDCRQLIIGTGAHGGLPVMDEVKEQARIRQITLTILPTPMAIKEFNRSSDDTHAILHVTC